MTTKDGKPAEDFSIKPSAVTPTLDTSQWPLLLKNYEKRTSEPLKHIALACAFFATLNADFYR